MQEKGEDTMNLLDKYRENPNHYLLRANGGFGKTTSLLYMSQMLLGERLENGRTVIPIYVKMSEWNVKRIEPNMIYEYILRYFNNGVSVKALRDMFRESQGYQFLFLLDGLNEVIDYELENGQSVYTYIMNDIGELLTFENVHLIITTRPRCNVLTEEIEECFQSVEIANLSEEQITEYLGVTDLSFVNDYLREQLKNPMLLKMFKSVYEYQPQEALQIKSKYSIMEYYFKLDVELKRDLKWTDNLLAVRKYILNDILPLIAFEVECALMDLENRMDLQYEELLDKIFEQYRQTGERVPYRRELIEKVIRMMDLVDENLIFSHDLVREYLALCGMELQKNFRGFQSKVKLFFERLTENLRYIKKNGTELTRRTRHLDLAELIYGQVGGKLVAILNVQYGVGELEARNLAQNFYQELAGVYDDMKQRELSAQVGWIGVELLDGLTLSELDKARKLNYLYYCTLNGRKRDPLYLLEEAKCILGRIPEGTRIEDEHVLYGAILSNMGAYYTTPFNKSYKKALKYHMEALKYRKEHSKEDCGNSYRTLMSDYFYLKDFQKAYEMMCAGLESETGYRRLSEILNVEQREEIEVPIDLLERGLGSEMRLLMDEKTSIELREEIQMEILCQIPYIYQESVKADEGRRRVDTRMLKSLYGKLEELNWGEFHEEWFEPMRKTVEEYRIKCKAIL